MSSVAILKINGWPKTFDERVVAISRRIDHTIVVRPKPTEPATDLAAASNIDVFDLRPARGSYVEPPQLKPLIFLVHAVQAILLLAYLIIVDDTEIDAIHALDYALGGFVGAVVSQLFSIPLVVSVRGLKEPRYRSIAEAENTYSAWISYRILATITRFVLGRADHVVTKAPYQTEFVRETFGVDPGFTTVPTGVDFDVFDPATVSEDGLRRLLSEAGHELQPGDRIILYLAKIVPEKGPDSVLKLLAEVDSEIPDDVVFAFVGEFRDGAFEQKFRELEKEVPCRTALYPHRVPFKDVPSLLYDADGVILLSEAETEGTPRILQEACAMGTPIVASDVDGIKGAFADLPGCYLIDRTDPEAFAEAIRGALDDSPELPRDLFAERFDMYENYARYADVYERLA